MATSTTTIPTQANGHNPRTSQAGLQTTANQGRDEFDSEEFEGGRESLPYLQMLNHPDSNQSGFFITAENREAVQFAPNEEWTPYTATFQSGETAEGYRSLIARFLILHRSPLLMFERESGDFMGEYRKLHYDRTTMVLKTRYLVFLVSRDKQLLHQSPLLLTTKGSFCGSFGEVVRAFHSAMSKAYGAATGARKPRGDRFMALSILGVRVQPELKGTTKKSWVCSVSDYGIPTPENWKSYFVGYNPERKEKVLTAFEEWSAFGSLERELESQTQRRQESQDATIATDDSEDGYDISSAYEEL